MKINKLLLVLLPFLIAIIAIFFIFTGNNDGLQIDKAPFEGEDPNGQQEVILTNGEELLYSVNGVEAYSFVVSDLYLFANTAYSEYIDDPERPVGFRIDTFEKTDQDLNMSGRFGATSNKIVVKIVPLKKNRVSLSITDTVTGLNIDDYLNSNSVKNKLIGQLPFDTTGFSINYIQDIDTFSINVFNDANNYNEAVNQIKSALGDVLFKRQKIVRYGAGDKQFDNGF